MTRMMLAASPWMMNGTNMAQRVVVWLFYKNKLAVHVQTYEQHGGDLGREVEFTDGRYFNSELIGDALTVWQNRTNKLLKDLDSDHRRVASAEFAERANLADYHSQFVK